jgi:predicted ArsR family transcriptional regulator
MSALFHGHVSSNRIDAALEQLISLGAIVQTNQPTGGRPATLWSATAEAQSMGGEETAHESTTEDATNEESMQEQTKFA